jgi:hypothetical protein
VVLNPATPLEQIEYVLPIVDLVLIMSVNPGFGGQKFIESQVDKIRRLKQMCLEKQCNPWIEVDGGVTPDNAWKVIEAGANAIVSGSGVFGAKDYATAIQVRAAAGTVLEGGILRRGTMTNTKGRLSVGAQLRSAITNLEQCLSSCLPVLQGIKTSKRPETVHA